MDAKELELMERFNMKVQNLSTWTESELMGGIDYVAIRHFHYAKMESIGIQLFHEELFDMEEMQLFLEAIGHVITDRESYARGEQF